MSTELAFFLVVVLLLLNAFFVASEFALVSARRSAIELRAADGSRAASITLHALKNISFLMAGAQLGITISSLGLGVLGEPAIAHLLEGPFHELHLPENLIHPLAFTIALAIMTFLHVVLAEMLPKNLALVSPERAAIVLGPMLVFVLKIMQPAVVTLNALANFVLRLLGIQPRAEVSDIYTRDEVADLVEESHREGLLSEDEEHLLSGALAFDKQTISSVYIPLRLVLTTRKSASYAEIEELSAKTGFSRFPIKSKLGLAGYIHIKDILETDPQKRLHTINPRFIRPLIKVRTTDSLRHVLRAMRYSETHLAAVMDTRSRTVGLVTLEDVLEALVGKTKVLTNERKA